MTTHLQWAAEWAPAQLDLLISWTHLNESQNALINDNHDLPLVITVPADGLAPNGARPSAGKCWPQITHVYVKSFSCYQWFHAIFFIQNGSENHLLHFQCWKSSLFKVSLKEPCITWLWFYAIMKLHILPFLDANCLTCWIKSGFPMSDVLPLKSLRNLENIEIYIRQRLRFNG